MENGKFTKGNQTQGQKGLGIQIKKAAIPPIGDVYEYDVPSIKEFIKYNSQEFTTDYYSNGKEIPNSRKNKVIKYVNSLNLSIPQKALLIKMEYNSYKKYDKQIAEYI